MQEFAWEETASSKKLQSAQQAPLTSVSTITRPTVSVMLLTRNNEANIRRCVDSILMQRVDCKIDIVCVDNGSSDDTNSIVAEMMATLKSDVSYHNLQLPYRVGSGEQFRSGLNICKGSYIFTIDGNDRWLSPDKISTQLDHLEEDRVIAVSSTNYFTFFEDSKTFIGRYDAGRGNTYATAVDLIRNNQIETLSSCAFRRSDLEALDPDIFLSPAFTKLLPIALMGASLAGLLPSIMTMRRLPEAIVGNKSATRNYYIEQISQANECLNILDGELEAELSAYIVDLSSRLVGLL